MGHNSRQTRVLRRWWLAATIAAVALLVAGGVTVWAVQGSTVHNAPQPVAGGLRDLCAKMDPELVWKALPAATRRDAPSHYYEPDAGPQPHVTELSCEVGARDPHDPKHLSEVGASVTATYFPSAAGARTKFAADRETMQEDYANRCTEFSKDCRSQKEWCGPGHGLGTDSFTEYLALGIQFSFQCEILDDRLVLSADVDMVVKKSPSAPDPFMESVHGPAVRVAATTMSTRLLKELPHR